MGSSGSTATTSRNTSKPVNKTNTQKTGSNQNAQNTQKNVQAGQKAPGTQQNSNTIKDKNKGPNTSNAPGQGKVPEKNVNTAKGNNTGRNTNKEQVRTKVSEENANTTKDKNKGQNTSKGHGTVASNGNTSRKPQETRGNVGKQNPQQQQQQQQQQQNKGKPVAGKNSTQKETIKEKGWKKRIRERLRNASAGNDKEELEHLIETFENNKLVDGGDLTEAKEKMNYLLLRQHIRDAILRRHPTILDEAIADVENSKYSADLQPYVVKAKQVKAELAGLDKHDVLEMEQQTISEIRSYKYPPPGVRETMIATYMVLGYHEDDVKEWQDLTALMGRYGKDSLMREVAAADGSTIDSQSAIRIKKYLAKYSLDDVRAVSNGAATFYIWASEMVNSKGGGGGGGVGGGGQAQPPSTNNKKTTTPQQKQQTQQQQQQKQKEQQQKQQQQKQKEQQQKQQQQPKQKEQKQQQQPKQKEQQKQQQNNQQPHKQQQNSQQTQKQQQNNQQTQKQQQNKQQQSQKNSDPKQQSTRGDTTQRTAGKK